MSSKNTPKKLQHTIADTSSPRNKPAQNQDSSTAHEHHEVLFKKSEMLQKTVTAESQLDLIQKQIASLLKDKEEALNKLRLTEEQLQLTRAHSAQHENDAEKLNHQLIEKTEQLNAAQTVIAELKERINFLLTHTHSTSSRIHQIFQLLEFQGTQQ